jgi:hypothetical protein
MVQIRGKIGGWERRKLGEGEKLWIYEEGRGDT